MIDYNQIECSRGRTKATKEKNRKVAEDRTEEREKIGKRGWVCCTEF